MAVWTRFHVSSYLGPSPAAAMINAVTLSVSPSLAFSDVVTLLLDVFYVRLAHNCLKPIRIFHLSIYVTDFAEIWYMLSLEAVGGLTSSSCLSDITFLSHEAQIELR